MEYINTESCKPMCLLRSVKKYTHFHVKIKFFIHTAFSSLEYMLWTIYCKAIFDDNSFATGIHMGLQ